MLLIVMFIVQSGSAHRSTPVQPQSYS